MACAAAHRATLRSLLGPDLHAFGEEHLVNLPWWTHWDNGRCSAWQILAATHPDAIPDRFSRTDNGITNTPSGFCLKIGYGTISQHIPKFHGQSPLFCVLPIEIRSLRRGSIPHQSGRTQQSCRENWVRAPPCDANIETLLVLQIVLMGQEVFRAFPRWLLWRHALNDSVDAVSWNCIRLPSMYTILANIYIYIYYYIYNINIS